MEKKALKAAIILAILLILSLSYSSLTLAEECVIEAISYSKDNPAAMINGHPFMIGDSVCGGKIVAISSDKVSIQYAEEKKDFSVSARKISSKNKVDTTNEEDTTKPGIVDKLGGMFNGLFKQATETKRHYFKEEGFSIEIPKEFEMKHVGGYIGFHVDKNKDNKFEELIGISVFPKAAYIDITVPGEKVVKTGSIIIDGTRAKWVLSYYKGTPRLEYTFSKDESVYEITCATDKKEIISYKERFDKILQSINFE